MGRVPEIQPKLSGSFNPQRILSVLLYKGDSWCDNNVLCQLGVGWPRFRFKFADHAYRSFFSFINMFRDTGNLGRVLFLILTRSVPDTVPWLCSLDTSYNNEGFIYGGSPMWLPIRNRWEGFEHSDAQAVPRTNDISLWGWSLGFGIF